MPKFFLAIYLLLILCGCSNREKGDTVPNYGYRYFVNKVVLIDGSTADMHTTSDACSDLVSKMGWLVSQNIPESEWHRYAKTDKRCTSLLKGRPDTASFFLQNPSDTALCDSDGKCIVKPDVYLRENNVFQVSFCNSKYYTQMRYDSLNISKDFESARSTWGTSYEISVADSLIVLNGLNKEVKMFFYVEKKRMVSGLPIGNGCLGVCIGPF